MGCLFKSCPRSCFAFQWIMAALRISGHALTMENAFRLTAYVTISLTVIILVMKEQHAVSITITTCVACTLLYIILSLRAPIQLHALNYSVAQVIYIDATLPAICKNCNQSVREEVWGLRGLRLNYSCMRLIFTQPVMLIEMLILCSWGILWLKYSTWGCSTTSACISIGKPQLQIYSCYINSCSI